MEPFVRKHKVNFIYFYASTESSKPASVIPDVPPNLSTWRWLMAITSELGTNLVLVRDRILIE